MEEKEIRPAILRLFYDMINADGIIHDEEIAYLEYLKEKYGILPADKDGTITYEAHKMTFSDALMRLKKWKNSDVYSYRESYDKNKGKIYPYSVYNIQSDLLKLAISDKDNSPIETLIMLAYDYVVIDEKATSFACKERELRFSKKEIIYIEDKKDRYELINDEITNNYTLISDKLKLHGFEFVYIPHERESLLKKEKEGILKNVIRFIHPINVKSIEDAGNIVNELKEITTDKFIKYYFNKNNISKTFSPSILIKLKKTRVAQEHSITKYESYSNFLMIPIENNVVNTINVFTEKYLSLLGSYTCNVLLSSNEMINGHGFHKTLLNYLVYKSFSGEIETLIIDYEKKRKEYIEFVGINQKCHLTSSEIAVYVIILVMTYFKEYGGLYRDGKNIEPKVLEKIQDVYRDIADEGDMDIYTSIKSIIPKINSKIGKVPRLETYINYQINNPRQSRRAIPNNLKYSLNLNFNIVRFKFEGKTMSLDEWIERYWKKQ